jgi:Cu2+-exporting ATPase
MTSVDADLTGFLGRTREGEGRLELLVRGARCAGCLAKIEKAAASAPGVDHARLNLTTGKLSVTFKIAHPDPARGAVWPWLSASPDSAPATS